MKLISNRNLTFTNNEVFLISALSALSMLICFWMQYIQHGRLNPDSVLYFESAKYISMGDWSKATLIYNWPFYSICIAFVHKITSLDISHAAELVNTILFGITSASFLQIIRQLNGKKLEIVCGALVLLSSRHIVGEMLGMQTRDEGLWAFLLLSTVYFIDYYKYSRLKSALLWQLTILIAALFRIEAISLMLFLPLTLLIGPQHFTFKLQHITKCYLLLVAIAIILLTSLYLGYNFGNFGRLGELSITNFYVKFTATFLSRAVKFGELVLGKYLEGYAITSLLLTIAYIIALKIIHTTGVINFILCLLAGKKRKVYFEVDAFIVLFATIIISYITLFLFVTQSFVMVGRYAASISLIILIFASFSAADIIGQLRNGVNDKKALIAIALILFSLVNLTKNLTPEICKTHYIKQSVEWLKNYNKENYATFYDDKVTRYFAGMEFIQEANQSLSYIENSVNSGSIEENHFLLIHYNEKKREKTKLLNKTLASYRKIKKFQDDKSNYIVIYEKTN